MYWGVPDSGARETLPHSPFLDEHWAGYARWKEIDNGSMFGLLRPYASGVGMHVGQLIEPACCIGNIPPISNTVVTNNDFTPWLFPTEITWHSIMDENNQPLQQFIEAFDVDYPCVAITSANSSSSGFRWGLDNLNFEFESERFYSYDPNEDLLQVNGLHLIGIVPAWTVTPLHETSMKILQEAINKIQLTFNYELLNECWCTIEYFECEEECEQHKDYNKQCTCNSQEKIIELLGQMYTTPTNITSVIAPDFLEIWETGVKQFYEGWQIIHNYTKEQETWASYWQRLQSPFSAFPGQSPKELLELKNLTNSQTQQAS